ncbi:MAG: iron-containing alcohol dehydrogenase [Defluviitaleaceae bacterium]|nr:iron-containing alcohol dehydrogenase [Defluviitaleaceae bacterium]
MQSFIQYTPTEIVFGPGVESQTAQLVKKHGGTKVLVVYGTGSIEKSGLLGKITDQLASEGIPHLMHGGATPNPHLSFARAGVKAAIAFGVDFILAIGGGSAIDAAKAVAHGTKNPEIDIWKFWLREEPLTKSLPIGVVLTISAAGSETSNSAVLTNTEEGLKRGLNTDFNRPAFAIMNPELTYTLPRFQISCGITDIMMHTLDRYFSPEANEGKVNEMTDEIAESLLRVVIKNGPLVLQNPEDYQAQSEIMWCGSLSHNGICGLGRTMDFSVHQLGHELGGSFDVAHGASLTTMWGSWARYCLDVNPARFARYARKVWGVTQNDDYTAAKEGIEKTVEYFKSIDMPTCFTELGIGIQSDEVLEQLSYSCVHFGKRLVGSFKPLKKEDIFAIYKAANK